MRLFYYFLLTSIFVMSCVSTKSNKRTAAENWKYQYSENGCDTGVHQFPDKASYCDGLKDEETNNGCAASIRKKMYEQNCTESAVASKPINSIPTPTPEASEDLPNENEEIAGNSSGDNDSSESITNPTMYGYKRCISNIEQLAQKEYKISYYCTGIKSGVLNELDKTLNELAKTNCKSSFEIDLFFGTPGASQICTVTPSSPDGYSSNNMNNVKTKLITEYQAESNCDDPKTVSSIGPSIGNLNCP